MKSRLLVALLFSSVATLGTAFADDTVVARGTIDVAQGDAGGPCASGYIFNGTDLNTGASILLCAALRDSANLGDALKNRIETGGKAKREKAYTDLLAYLSEQGTVIVSGDAPADDITLAISTVELAGGE